MSRAKDYSSSELFKDIYESRPKFLYAPANYSTVGSFMKDRFQEKRGMTGRGLIGGADKKATPTTKTTASKSKIDKSVDNILTASKEFTEFAREFNLIFTSARGTPGAIYLLPPKSVIDKLKKVRDERAKKLGVNPLSSDLSKDSRNSDPKDGESAPWHRYVFTGKGDTHIDKKEPEFPDKPFGEIDRKANSRDIYKIVNKKDGEIEIFYDPKKTPVKGKLIAAADKGQYLFSVDGELPKSTRQATPYVSPLITDIMKGQGLSNDAPNTLFEAAAKGENIDDVAEVLFIHISISAYEHDEKEGDDNHSTFNKVAKHYDGDSVKALLSLATSNEITFDIKESPYSESEYSEAKQKLYDAWKKKGPDGGAIPNTRKKYLEAKKKLANKKTKHKQVAKAYEEYIKDLKKSVGGKAIIGSAILHKYSDSQGANLARDIYTDSYDHGQVLTQESGMSSSNLEMVESAMEDAKYIDRIPDAPPKHHSVFAKRRPTAKDFI